MNIVVAMTGASGAVFAARLLDILQRGDHHVHLTFSPAASLVFQQELGVRMQAEGFHPSDFVRDCRRALRRWGLAEHAASTTPAEIDYHRVHDFMSPIASGSHLTDGMVVCPCSGGTLSAIVHGLGNNLIHRAADVHLKERRPLIVVPRETPLSAIQLDNMRRLAEAGAVVMPAMPGWYHGVSTVMDLVDFMVARILDQLRIPHQLVRRWGDTESSA